MTPQPQIAVNHLSRSAYDAILDAIAPHLGVTFPAAALTIVHEGRVVLDWACGVLDPESDRGEVTPQTRFDLASLTKLFTATAFLSLVSAGRADVDTPLVDVLPEFGAIRPRPIDGGQDPFTKEPLPVVGDSSLRVDPARVTFRHLLTHTSGLPPWRSVYAVVGADPAPPDRPDALTQAERWRRALAALCAYPFVADPAGTVVRYSDIGLMLLGEVVARLHSAGDTATSAWAPRVALDVPIEERVTRRLGITDCGFNPVRYGIGRERLAPTEFDSDWRRRRLWGEVHDENACGVGGIAGHAGLFATAEAVAQMGEAWRIRDPRLRIAPHLLDEAVREHAHTGDERRGLGWMLKSSRGSSAGDGFSPDSFGHTGFTGTSLWVDPLRGLVVAFLTNRVYHGRENWRQMHASRRALHDAIAGSV